MSTQLRFNWTVERRKPTFWEHALHIGWGAVAFLSVIFCASVIGAWW